MEKTLGKVAYAVPTPTIDTTEDMESYIMDESVETEREKHKQEVYEAGLNGARWIIRKAACGEFRIRIDSLLARSIMSLMAPEYALMRVDGDMYVWATIAGWSEKRDNVVDVCKDFLNTLLLDPSEPGETFFRIASAIRINLYRGLDPEIYNVPIYPERHDDLHEKEKAFMEAMDI